VGGDPELFEDGFVSDSDSDLTDLEFVLDSDLEERELDEEEDKEIRDDIALLTFSTFLHQAQQLAIKAKKKKMG